MVGFRVSGRLPQGPAVRLTDRRHPLRLVLQGQMYGRASLTCDDASPESRRPGISPRSSPVVLDVLTMTRSADLQVRCAVVAQVERAVLTLHPLFSALGAKLDSITDFVGPSRQSHHLGCHP